MQKSNLVVANTTHVAKTPRVAKSLFTPRFGRFPSTIGFQRFQLVPTLIV